ncbi:MAG: DUF420 domain-containing protein [Verrucomicrobiaceae bacterium]
MSEREDFRELPVQEEKAAKMRRGVWVISVLVLVLVAVMRSPYKIPLPEGVEFSVLPKVHAGLNCLVAACLLAALFAIGRGKVRLHKQFMTGALVVSGLFLLSYVAYHFTTMETLYGDIDGGGAVDDFEKEQAGWRRPVYLGILIAHIVAAAVSFPLILMTFVHAWTNNFEKHKRLARKVWPLWFFVAVTGPVCYFMLRPYY